MRNKKRLTNKSMIETGLVLDEFTGPHREEQPMIDHLERREPDEDRDLWGLEDDPDDFDDV